MDNPIRLHWLDPRDPRQPFPPANRAMRDPNGLLAIGGDLSVTRLLRAYSQGIFPWYNPDEPILWWCPDPRAVLVPAEFHTSRSLQRRLRKGDFAISFDRVFEKVVESCAAPRSRGRGTWLGADMQRAYSELFRLGHAHSLEVWKEGRLVGGIYGVALGRVFFGESMFSAIEDASKVALHHLCRQLTKWGYHLLDCQIASAHLTSLGAIEIPRDEFLHRLRQAQEQPGRDSDWVFEYHLPDESMHLPPARLIRA